MTTQMPTTQVPLCPACQKPMLYNAEGLAKNPRAPTWKCSDRNCKWQLNPQTNQYEPSEYITGLWDRTTPRQVAQVKFEQELKQDVKSQQIKEMHDEKTENIAKSVALNNATELMASVISHYTRFSDFDEVLKELYNIADKNLEWLKKE